MDILNIFGHYENVSRLSYRLPLHEPEETYPPLDFNQVKGQIAEALDRKKALILQALRWVSLI